MTASGRPWAMAVGLLMLLACSGGERQFTGPGDDDGNGIEKPSLAVTVRVDPPDADLAAGLGWETGVPDADVHLLRNGTAEWTTRATDASGKVTFDDLVSGRYRLYAERRLTEEEADAATGGVLRAFGDGTTLDVSGSGANTAELWLLADRPGGLVISEINSAAPPPWETDGSYLDGHYLEVYNNSPQTLYLDGLLFGSGHFFNEETDHTPCAASQPIRNDSGGLYVRQVVQFPGSGAEHPIAPGEAKVVAVAAIDHSPVHSMLLDLSDAEFEIGSPARANNPAVPDMIDVGLEPFVPPPPFPSPLIDLSRPFFLAEPLDVGSLPVAWRDFRGRGWVLIPAEAILESIALKNLWPDQDRESFPCIPMVHPRFDRYEGGFLNISFGIDPADQDFSYVRRALRTEGGRVVLQNVNTSATDFFLGPHTPGALPQ